MVYNIFLDKTLRHFSHSKHFPKKIKNHSSPASLNNICPNLIWTYHLITKPHSFEAYHPLKPQEVALHRGVFDGSSQSGPKRLRALGRAEGRAYALPKACGNRIVALFWWYILNVLALVQLSFAFWKVMWKVYVLFFVFLECLKKK